MPRLHVYSVIRTEAYRESSGAPRGQFDIDIDINIDINIQTKSSEPVG